MSAATSLYGDTANNSLALFWPSGAELFVDLLLMRWKPRLELGVLLPYWHLSLSCSHLLSYDPIAAGLIYLHSLLSGGGVGGLPSDALQMVKSFACSMGTWVQSESGRSLEERPSPTQCLLPGKSHGLKAWQATGHGCKEVRPAMKQLHFLFFTLWGPQKCQVYHLPVYSYLLYNYAESSELSSYNTLCRLWTVKTSYLNLKVSFASGCW